MSSHLFRGRSYKRKSMQKYLLLVLLLVLGHIYTIVGHPLPTLKNSSNITAISDISGSGEISGSGDTSSDSGEIPQTKTTITARPPLNEYVEQFFLRQRILKESNCTLTFLGQNVSKHLCNSNLIKLLFPQGSEANHAGDNYELCSDAVREELGGILGYDLVLYKRPTNVNHGHSTSCQELMVMITETVRVQGGSWTQLLSSLMIPSDAEGWYVFHLSSRINDYLNIPTVHVCFQVNIQACGEEEHSTYTRLLNRSQIGDVFVVSDTREDERNRQPVGMAYIRKFIPPSGISPFFPTTTGPFLLK